MGIRKKIKCIIEMFRKRNVRMLRFIQPAWCASIVKKTANFRNNSEKSVHRFIFSLDAIKSNVKVVIQYREFEIFTVDINV